MNSNSSYDLLISKLDAFTRKYYLNKTIKGSLYFVGLSLTVFLLFNVLEDQFYFDRGTRKVIFFSFLATMAITGYLWILDPLLRYFKLGKTISHEQAAQIIGTHFQNVEDKLLNILHLKQQESSAPNKALLLAGIEQKTEQIKLVPFQSAINLNSNKRYLRYALPPTLILLGLIFMSPNLIKDSTYRLLNTNKDFMPDAPFQFTITNPTLETVQFKDFELEITVDGAALPNEAFIEIEDFMYKLEKVNNTTFKYTFRNIQKNTAFTLKSGKVVDKKRDIEVIEKPNLSDFSISLDYPAYTGRKDEVLSNNGDLNVPAGTKINWNFTAANTDAIALKFLDAEPKEASKKSSSTFEFKGVAYKDQSYTIFYSNERIPTPDSLQYQILVTPDNHPSITAEQFIDSTNLTQRYFAGSAADDYGLTQITFHYTITNKDGKSLKEETRKISQPTARDANFQYEFDLNTLGLKPGDQVSYYFEAFDNDAVNGIKSTKSQTMTFAKPTIEELKQLEQENEEAVKSTLKNNQKDLEDMEEKFRKMREKLLQKKELEWQDKRDMEKLIEEQKKLYEQLEQAKEKLDKNMENRNELDTPEDLKEREEKLNEMMKDALDPETKDLMDKIQELMQELEKEDAVQMLEQFQMNNENLSKQMERLQELYKQLEMEKEVREQIKNLEELAKKQEELAKETELEKPLDAKDAKQDQKNQDKNAESKDEKKSDEKSTENQKDKNSDKKDDNSKDQDKNAENKEQKGKENSPQNDKSASDKQKELEKKQDQINKEFEDIQKEMDKLEKQNEELNPPKNLGDQNEEKMDDIKDDLNDSKKQLQKQENKSASKSQKQAAQKMKKMAGDLQESMQSGQQKQQAENLKTIRQLLENLVTVSFDQESLVSSFNETPSTTPKFVDLVKKQFKLKDDFAVIEDSLTALSKRVEQIESFITEKVTEVKYNLASSIEQLEERQVAQAADKQRRTMTNLNDLALMLSESMKNMQEAMASGMPGSQMCDQPGATGEGKQGKVPMDKITEGQQGMEGELKGLQEKMGKQGKDGASAKDFAQAAARQAALRKALQDLQKEKQEQGKGGGDFNEIINQMDKIETELVNKRLNSETLKRQQDIVTRLLEAEKSERQREFDEKRKSEVGKEMKRELPPSLQAYLKERESEIQLYKTISPSLKPYYKSLVDDYYNALKGNMN